MKTSQKITFLLLLLPIICYGQNLSYTTNRIGLTVAGLDYSIEKQINMNKSLIFSAELVYDFFRKRGISGDESGWGLSPLLYVEPRWYYNFIKRQRDKKKVVFNSSNYLGMYVGYRFWPIVNKNLSNEGNFFLVPNIGFQRTVGKRVTVDPKFGYSFLFNGAGVYSNSLFIDLKISLILLNSKQKKYFKFNP